MANKGKKYNISKVVAEAAVILKTDASQVRMPEYQPRRLNTKSPSVKKIFSISR